jgi:guanine deaminase
VSTLQRVWGSDTLTRAAPEASPRREGGRQTVEHGPSDKNLSVSIRVHLWLNFFMKLKFMREAIRLSLQKMRGNHGGPFGAVVVRRGKIVGRGWNRVTSGNDPTAHAEVVAIREACRRLKTFQLDDCELYTSCEPCPMCLAAGYWARLRRIYYANTRRDAAAIGFDDDFLYREVVKPVDRRNLPMKQLLRREALTVFAEWQNKPDKIRY